VGIAGGITRGYPDGKYLQGFNVAGWLAPLAEHGDAMRSFVILRTDEI
jgi:hypothetical protein